MNEAWVCEIHQEAGHLQPCAAPPRGQSDALVTRALHVVPSAPVFADELRSELQSLARAGRERPAASVARIHLDLARAWQMVIRGEAAEALLSAQRLEGQVGPLTGPVAVAVRCEIAAVRAAALLLQDDAGAALAAALSALRLGTATPTAHVALTVCRCAYLRLGDPESFYAVERRAPDAQPGRLRAVTRMLDIALDAAVEFAQMHFNAARLLADDALDVARRFGAGPATIDALPACVMAQVLYEEGRVDESEALVAARLPGIRQGGAIEGAVRAYGLLARIAANRRQPGQALLLLAEADALGIKRNWPRLRAASLAQQVEIHAGADRLDEAALCAQRLAVLAGQCGAASSSARFEIARYRVLAQARLALAKTHPSACAPAFPQAPIEVSAAIDLVALRQLHSDTVLRRDRYGAVTIALLLIEALLVAGLRDDAVEALVTLLKQAASAGLQQTLVDCSERVAKLIDGLVRGSIVPAGDVRELLPYAGALMSRRRRGDIKAQPASDTARDIARSVAAMGLSERERVIIGLMGRGLTNKQIAIRLCIAPETVKSHAKHLYSKLSVRNRIEAVTLASRLGLVRLSGCGHAGD
ncbi:LuxR C-terminal-related transcriptional regulator [Paraburkholderia nemoris]|uniref:HTH-type transcriptional regulator MalT n=1 Tax=Paraburkholderia nemoris TaxID=2793076 RepID=A0ABN7LKD3_9BURK|nr:MULTISPECIES: LuxR C-terminal-related transcriptional regulator [Paraburkholderia]MBK3741296.1 response regulator transcription factor [Paraburkholderia aspalathi]MBK3811104.1 response regulator transcription factor [Paraburkholderia aspalathi]CAE6746243.1 HTH-type transcriptional regulator MalT [Paraburkholderia nemoris]CAE6749413.1 HTH-type transcriptional regulator MalT [Paraburkholderia nemoris]CAE6801913.1 HTH-type transcriptional regulator MalT [Paraburkholderia nemoris]